MDTGIDLIRPEFLNIIFFQQKNLVIFPYIDLKHLHTLEIFTEGYNVVNLESTALNNLKEIIEFESSNSYSQTPTFFFIYNVNRENVKNLLHLNRIHCIINSNENVSDLANGNKFIFFNKKNGQFLNYDVDDLELEFESHLINVSQNQEILQEEIHKIKITASKLFRELNQDSSLNNFSEILKDYDKKYWNSIVQFTSHYYDINIPNISGIIPKPQKIAKDYSDEYETCVTTNKQIGKEFIQLLHEYRGKKVNSAHLELEELFNPQKLYRYLRNHHWKDGIPRDFIKEWYQMDISNYKLTESDELDFEIILNQLKIPLQLIPTSNIISSSKEQEIVYSSEDIPSIYIEPKKFREWFYIRLSFLEKIVNKYNNISKGQKSIKIHKISNTKIREMFSSADQIFTQFQNSAKFDASGVINYYSKGLESILHEKVSSYFEPLIQKYKRKLIRKETSTEFNKKFGNLMQKKSISPGIWARIMKDRDTPYKDTGLQEFYNCIEDNFDINTIMAIQRACEFISHYREAHSNIISMGKVLAIRPKAIDLLNSVIDKLYDNFSEYSTIPSLSNFSQFKSCIFDRLGRIEHLLDIQ